MIFMSMVQDSPCSLKQPPINSSMLGTHAFFYPQSKALWMLFQICYFSFTKASIKNAYSSLYFNQHKKNNIVQSWKVNVAYLFFFVNFIDHLKYIISGNTRNTNLFCSQKCFFWRYILSDLVNLKNLLILIRFENMRYNLFFNRI